MCCLDRDCSQAMGHNPTETELTALATRNEEQQSLQEAGVEEIITLDSFLDILNERIWV